MDKWLELSILLKDYTRTNEVLATVVKPYIEQLYKDEVLFHWHFFREPSICWRIMASEEAIEGIKAELNKLLERLEQEYPELYEKHYFGAFLEQGKEYMGEQELYGMDAWELCYKRWESGSNLALLLCTTKPTKTLPFHYTRDIHLFENQLGFELSDEITICLKWAKRLMECDAMYASDLELLSNLILRTKKASSVEGI